MAKPGPKRDPINLALVEECSKKGMTEESIARVCGYNPTWFSELKAKNPELTEAIKKGRADNQRELLESLNQLANKEKNLGAIIFALKSIHHFRDQPQQIELIGKDGGPINLDMSVMPPEERRIKMQELKRLEDAEDE